MTEGAVVGQMHVLDGCSGMGDEVLYFKYRSYCGGVKMKDEPETGDAMEDEAERLSGGSGEIRSGRRR